MDRFEQPVLSVGTPRVRLTTSKVQSSRSLLETILSSWRKFAKIWPMQRYGLINSYKFLFDNLIDVGIVFHLTIGLCSVTRQMRQRRI